LQIGIEPLKPPYLTIRRLFLLGKIMLVFVDQMVMDEKPRRTADGYLLAMPRVARTGIQDYLGSEVGKPELKSVKVYRPESEVFSIDTLNSFAGRPVTVEHPPVLVDANNWKKYSRGQTGEDVLRDGEFMKLSMLVMDSNAIAEIDAGKREISLGYTATLDFTPGVTESGEAYDAVQRNIRGNHLAIVDAARGGSKLRVIDTLPSQEDLFMATKTIMVDGISVEVSDTAAQVVEKTIKALNDKAKTDADKIKELEDELAELKGKAKTDTETKDAKIATLEKQLGDAALTPEKLDQAVKARAAVIDSAKKVLSTVVVDGKSDADIRKQVVVGKMGDTAKDWTDAQIEASFNTLAVAAPTTDSYARVVADSSNVVTVDADKARQEWIDSMQSSHPSMKARA
jgi:hypothetical protein